MALNPSIRIGDQIAAMLRGTLLGQRRRLPSTQALARRSNLPTTRRRSGGASRISSRAASSSASRSPSRSSAGPPLVVLDEPTTGLDVVTQARAARPRSTGCATRPASAMVYVSHDLAVVGAIADRIAVMYGGPHRRGGPGATEVLRTPAAPVHPRAACQRYPTTLDAAPAARHPGRGRRGRRAAAGLRVRAALSLQRVDRCEAARCRRSSDGRRPAIAPAASSGSGRRGHASSRR